eukprot:sb/3478185/
MVQLLVLQHNIQKSSSLVIPLLVILLVGPSFRVTPHSFNTHIVRRTDDLPTTFATKPVTTSFRNDVEEKNFYIMDDCSSNGGGVVMFHTRSKAVSSSRIWMS